MKTSINDHEKKLIELLLEDLILLERDVGGEHVTPKPSVVRVVITPILRRWICHKEIMRIRKIIDSPMCFPVYDHKEYVTACKSKKLSLWIGMVGINEVYISSCLPTNLDHPPTFNSNSTIKTFDAKDFCQQKILFLDGYFASRADVINFAANKLGGTHNPETEEAKKLKKHPLYNFDEVFGLAVLGGNIQMMRKLEFAKLEEYKNEGRVVYDIYNLVTLDTARRFVKGIQNIKNSLTTLSQQI